MTIQIEDIVFGKFGENDDQRVAHRHGRPVKESLASGDILVTGTSEDSIVSKTNGVWRKEGTNICPLEIGNSRIVAGLLPHAIKITCQPHMILCLYLFNSWESSNS